MKLAQFLRPFSRVIFHSPAETTIRFDVGDQQAHYLLTEYDVEANAWTVKLSVPEAVATTAPVAGQGDDAIAEVKAGLRKAKEVLMLAARHRGIGALGSAANTAMWQVQQAIDHVGALATHPAPKIESPRDLAAELAAFDKALDLPGDMSSDERIARIEARIEAGWEACGDAENERDALAERRATLDAAPARDPASAFMRAAYELAGKRPAVGLVEPAWNVDLFEVERRAGLAE